MRKVWKVVGISGLVLALAAAALVLRAHWVLERSYADVPEPPITADTSPEGVARGELLFHSICFECHGGADGRATGKALYDVPSFLGEVYAANLAHPEHGVRRRTDGQLARVIRHGVLPDGRLSVLMNAFGKIGDRDVAAILGYLRSPARVFDPAGEDQPRTRFTLTGKVILTYVAKVGVRAPTSGMPVPPKEPTAAYGRYMVDVLDCGGCHTDGFASDKTEKPGAFAGGFELTDPLGAKIWTKNITPDDETGIGRWSAEDFHRAVTAGTTPTGELVRRPMPMFARLDRTDTEAVYAYLRTVPKVHRRNVPGGTARPSTPESAEVLFARLGCAGCHGDGAVHRDKLAGALAKSDDEVADWILDPQAKKPGVLMPPFKSVIDREQAIALARYAKSRARAAVR